MMRKLKKIISVFLLMTVIISALPFEMAKTEAASVKYMQTVKDSVPLRNEIGEDNTIMSRIASINTVVEVLDKKINWKSLQTWYKVYVEKGTTNNGHFGEFWVWSGNITSHSHGNFSAGLCGYTGCPYKRTYTKLNSTKKQMKVKNASSPVRCEPYNDGKPVISLKKNAVVTTYGVVENLHNKEWYILNDGNFIYSGNLKAATERDTQNESNNVSNGGGSGSGGLFEGLSNAACKLGMHQYNVGKCTNCGDEFKHREHATDKNKVYKASKTLAVKQKPYDAAVSVGKTYQSGEVVPVTAYTSNSYGNTWYKTSEGWVYGLEDATFKSASLNLSTYTFTNMNDSVTPVLTLSPKNAAIESVKWSLEDTAVAAAASVDQNGRITPVTSGKIYVYCTVKPVGQKAQKLSVLINVTKDIYLENWEYSQNNFSYGLAAKCSLFASLAYPGYTYTYHSDEMRYSTYKNSGGKKTPENLTRYLIDEGYSYKISNNYYNMTEYNSPFVMAYKDVRYNGKRTPVVYVIIEGSAGRAGWQGNMKMTGSSYTSGLTEHYTFEEAAKDMKKQLEKFMKDCGIYKPIVVITGHSRGSATGNLLAQKLNGESSSYTQISAYLFATPNCTKKPVRSSNIFNICNEEDFVARIPFSSDGWGFQKHGRIFAFNAAKDNITNSTFRKYAKDVFKKSTYAESPQYVWNADSLSGMSRYITGKWKNVEEYYTHNPWTYSEITAPYCNDVEAYDFFYKGLALAACGDSEGITNMAIHLPHKLTNVYNQCPFFKITVFFAADAKVTDTFAHNHEMMTYNSAVNAKILKEKTDAHVFSSDEYGNGTVDIDETEREALYSFFNSGENALMLEEAGWDIENPETWSGIKWNTDGNVISIDLSYMNLSGWFNANAYPFVKDINVDGNALSMVAATNCTELETLSCSSNKLSALSVPNSENMKSLNCSFNNITSLDVSNLSQLADLNCHSNSLTDLNLNGAVALETVRCGNNQLSDVDISTNTSLSTFFCENNNIIESQNPSLVTAINNINENGGAAEIGTQKYNSDYSFNENELSALVSFAETSLNAEKLGWDMEDPWSWEGIEWKIENGEYHIVSVELDNKNLEGDLTLPEATYVEKVSCEGSSLSTLNLSGCTRLTSINCYDAGLSDITIDNCTSLTAINCDENYLEVSNVESSLNQIGLNTGAATYANQNVDAPEESFNQAEKEVLISLLSMAENYEVLGWETETPGSWEGITWINKDGEYRVNKIMLADKEITGEIDLSGFAYLENFDFSGTQIEKVTLPDCVIKIPEGAFYNSGIKYVYMEEGVTNIGKSAFARCENLTTIVMPSTVAKIEDKAFYNSINLENLVFMGDEPLVVGEEVAHLTSPEFKITYFSDSVWNGETELMSLYTCLSSSDECIVVLSEVPGLKTDDYYNESNGYGGDDIDVLLISKKADRRGMCILSVYDEHGRMKNVYSQAEELNKYMSVCTVEDVDIQYAGEEYCMIKGMFWESVGGMNPISAACEKVLLKPIA